MPLVDRQTRDEPTGAVALQAWLGSASYWQPAHIVTSAWLEHAPFAFWLMSELRPRTVAELGTHHGFSFFVFAEAARRLGLDTQLYAFDSWEGDDHSGFYDEGVYALVQSVAERDYPGRAHLVRGTFAQSRPRVADGSVDLLHIDGRHGYGDVKEDYEQWSSTVRDGGVILFHDIAEHERGFGVWRLWDELSARYPSFAFTHGHGLGVMGVGNAATPAIEALLGADDATTKAVRAGYERLGAVVSRQAEFEAMPAEVASLHEVVDVLSAQIDRLGRTVSEREATIAELQTSTSWRVTAPLRAVGAAVARLRTR